jgi:hemolysin III
VKTSRIPVRPQTPGEEIANSISHGLGLVTALVATPFLLVAANRQGSTWAVVGASVFAAAMIVLYLSSTLYHAIPHKRAKRVLQLFDHLAIFVLIAGTYTPFTLGILRGTTGWIVFGLIWGLAVLGFVLKIVGGASRAPVLSTCLYLGMGWLVVLAVRPLLERMPLAGIWWLLAGGLAYSAGIAAFAAVRLRYSHFVWHLFVLAGTVCHYVAVLRYAA